MTERPQHSEGDVKQEEDQEPYGSADSTAEQAKTREREMEENGEENAA